MDFDSAWSGFALSDFGPPFRGLTFDGASSLFVSTPYKGQRLLTRDEIDRLLLRRKGHHVPVEIFSEVFRYTVQADPPSRRELMLVCRYWHDIMLSTPGIQSQLRIYSWTKKKDVERFGKWWLLDVTVHPEHVPVDELDYELNIDPVEFHACFMAAAEAASRWRSLALLSLPPPGEYQDLQIIRPLQHLESFELAANCNLGNFLEPLLSSITTTITPRCTVMEIFHPDAALYLLQPAHLHVLSSLTTLRLICRRMQNPVDVMPSLHKLEIFEAHHIFLPIYPPCVDLPLTQTLRVLHLKSVSVQWMAGRIFPALKECSITFPFHSDAIHSVDMPSCSILKYASNNLGTLENFHTPPLDRLEIKCGQWRTWRGNLQLIRLQPTFAAQSLTCLHLEIKCSEWLLAYMLRLVPALEELWMVLSNPHALSSAFFLALAAGGHKVNAGPSSETIVPLGGRLRKLHLHYKRWLRGPERNGLIPAFGAVVASHPPEERIFSFRWSFGEGSEFQEWKILEPVERFDFGSASTRTLIGISSPYGIVPLSRALGDYDDVIDHDSYSIGGPVTERQYRPLPRDLEYIASKFELALPIEFFLSFHSLKEVRMPMLSLEMKPDTPFSLDAPLFHTLKTLYVGSIPSSFFAGQIFHKLEEYKEEWSYDHDEHMPGQGPLTEMPVCTRLVVSLSRLATLKLPQIRELNLSIDAKLDHTWEKHIAVNANLSGLKFLNLYLPRLPFAKTTLPTIAVIKVLASLPALETLITGVMAPHVNFFEAYVPMNVPGPSTLNHSSWKGQVSRVLCPRLESLQIQGISPTAQAELMPVLKDIVTLRAIIGSPLKSFIFSFYERPKGWQEWQLIGKDKSFTMEEVVPA